MPAIEVWVLLLALSGGNGLALDHAEFASQATCEAAGRAWGEVVRSNIIGVLNFRTPVALCVRK